MAEATTDPVRLPPGAAHPEAAQGVAFVAARDKAVAAVGQAYGRTFTLKLPIFGQTVVISDPALVKELFTANADLIARAGVTSARCSGPARRSASTATEHRERRKLLVPPFHGKRMVGYEAIVEEEVHARDRRLARGRGVRDHAVDDADHAQRDPAGGVRRRGLRTRRTARTTAADGAARVAAGRDAAGSAQGLRPVEPVGAGGAIAQALRRDHRAR